MAKQDEFSRYTIRVPRELYALLEKSAADENRSINAEIVEKLWYAVEHPYDYVNELAQSVDDLTAALESAHSRYENLVKHSEAIKKISDESFDFQRRLMYHILNYLDDIPEELAIWAWDIICSVERTEFIVEAGKNIGASEGDILKNIADARDKRKKEVMEFLRKFPDN